MEFLIVDNDRTSREEIAFLLEKEGHAAEGIAWTEEIWNRLREKTFDAILIDLDSNPGKGLDAFREMQKVQPNTLLVLLVVENTLNLAAEAMHRGILEILEKPFRREDLLLVIARLQRHMAMRRRVERLEQDTAKVTEPPARRVVIALLSGNPSADDERQRGKRIGQAHAT